MQNTVIALDTALSKLESAVNELDLLYNEGAQLTVEQANKISKLAWTLSVIFESYLRSQE